MHDEMMKKNVYVAEIHALTRNEPSTLDITRIHHVAGDLIVQQLCTFTDTKAQHLEEQRS
jgi:hypothetical protein